VISVPRLTHSVTGAATCAAGACWSVTDVGEVMQWKSAVWCCRVRWLIGVLVSCLVGDVGVVVTATRRQSFN